MTQFISKAVLCFVPLALLCGLANGQDIPAVTAAPTYQGFQLPTELGSFHYALTFAERLRTGYYGAGDDIWATDISGEAGYLSRSEKNPFSMTYSGGYLHNSGGERSSIFQSLMFSQAFTTRLFNTSISDSVSYLPEAASGGLSGIPGVGDVGVTAPPVGGDTGQDILSRDSQRVSNTASLSVQRQLTGSTSLQGGGSYFIQRFLTDASNALNTQDISGQAGLNHRIDALRSVQGNYSYSHFSYEGQNFRFVTQGITVGYTEQINRKLSVHAEAGPQIVSSGSSPQSTASVNISVNAGLTYATQHYDYSLAYVRGARAGSGVIPGAFTDVISGTAGRRLGEYMHVSASGDYSHNSSIANLTAQKFDVQTMVGNLQISRTISQNLNLFVSYGLQHQGASNLAVNTNAFTGTSQNVGFGITYSPRQLHLGHQ
jgi:hypothetical protein